MTKILNVKFTQTNDNLSCKTFLIENGQEKSLKVRSVSGIIKLVKNEEFDDLVIVFENVSDKFKIDDVLSTLDYKNIYPIFTEEFENGIKYEMRF